MTLGRVLLVVPSAAVLAGCGDNQSVLNPKSAAAAELSELSWALFVFGGVVLAIVVTAAALALRGSDAMRSILASPDTVTWGGIVFPVTALTLLLAYGIWLTRASQARLAEEAAIRIEVVGEQWWWRVSYVSPGNAAIASANEIRIPVGKTVQFALTSADVIHSFWVPNLGGKIDMIPGRTTSLRVQADEPGVYRGQCAEYCGGPHALMAFEVVAVPPHAFDAWLTRQSQPATAPSTARESLGQRMFLKAGCGACHNVRGTEASGVIGPDLTHLGTRRSVGLDTTALSEQSIAAFIRDGQHIKPGNLMPPFRIFTSDELGELAAYLAALR